MAWVSIIELMSFMCKFWTKKYLILYQKIRQNPTTDRTDTTEALWRCKYLK